MLKTFLPIFVVSACLVSGNAGADPLTQIIQRDLATLGYDPGNTDGEASVATAIAISKFQAEHDLEVTGEASPQLAGIIKASMRDDGPTAAPARPSAPARPAAAAPAALAAPPAPPGPAASDRDREELKAAQQECLQQRMAEAEQSKKRKRGLARLARAFSATASRLGGDEVSSEITQLSSDVYSAGAIASDFMGAAEDLGLTESDIEACRNPS